ncbi:metallophosphoesterase [Deinococcus deserti]|uniref:Putative serine/threonine phosphatases putative Metallophosphoesterase n=1 Tax=Deinococcus deserti (strain DSM 17065 / CIP 109153 / LMG 22923 / VCD115) TaxID=546414 RepID=C1CWP2_DEIDV|nr:metallophosphoesterase [Deinococcus deserti]ACO46609.1 putative serine/threonine phosphatases; putative Metallophosphoesterase [Deinococcus deserti VCD115]
MSELWVVGDIHGALDKLRFMLRSAGLIDAQGAWSGRDAHLVFLGDYLDRGPDGAGVVHLVQALEAQAPQDGGQVTALLGNHEVMFLAAMRFQAQDPRDCLGFYEYWAQNGGLERDAAGLDGDDLAWLSARPVLGRAGPWLLMHADSRMYLRLGGAVESVNARVTSLLSELNADAWGEFLNSFTERHAFVLAGGEEVAARTLRTFGALRLVHGHTPVYVLRDEHLHGPARGAGMPLLYAGNQALAMDSGMAYYEEAGFIARLSTYGLAEVVSVDERA